MDESLTRDDDLLADYAEMAMDEAREREAVEWTEALIADVANLLE